MTWQEYNQFTDLAPERIIFSCKNFENILIGHNKKYERDKMTYSEQKRTRNKTSYTEGQVRVFDVPYLSEVFAESGSQSFKDKLVEGFINLVQKPLTQTVMAALPK